MKAIAIAGRLIRDLDVESLADATADIRMEIVDAINAALQKIDAVAPVVAKLTTASFYLEPAMVVSTPVIQGSTEIDCGALPSLSYGRTIRIDGDPIDNQIVSATELLFPYTGASGNVTATIYSDSVALPEPYGELIGHPRIVETGRELQNQKIKSTLEFLKKVGPPRYYWIEANAQGVEGSTPALIRFDTLPDRYYRMQVEVTIAPSRVNFSDLLSPGPEIRLRAEYLESYLIPIARGILTGSSFWKDKETKVAARDSASDAESKYSSLVRTTMATPNNRLGTPQGY